MDLTEKMDLDYARRREWIYRQNQKRFPKLQNGKKNIEKALPKEARTKNGLQVAANVRKDKTEKMANSYPSTTTRPISEAEKRERDEAALIQPLKGGVAPKQQGTWVHPKVAINLAQWLSPQFAVQVSTRVFDWMEGRVAAKSFIGLFQRTCAGGGSIAEANYRRFTTAKKLKAGGVFYARFSC